MKCFLCACYVGGVLPLHGYRVRNGSVAVFSFQQLSETWNQPLKARSGSGGEETLRDGILIELGRPLLLYFGLHLASSSVASLLTPPVLSSPLFLFIGSQESGSWASPEQVRAADGLSRFCV